MFQFPFGTMHQLNLDWFLQQWQQLRQDWIDEEQHIEDSMQDIYDARDAAIQAKDDAVSAKNDAESAQAGVHADALMAEGFAVGEQGGTPVGPGSPYYQVNAKFYSVNAGTYRYLSEAYARGTMGGTPVDPGDAGYEDNAKYYKDAADLDAQSASDDAAFAAADALKAEGYAVGEQNGTPVGPGDPYYQDNAKYYAAEAQQDKEDADTFKAAAQTAALEAEGMTYGTQYGTPVGSDSPYYENNAEYFYQNTAGSDGALAQAMIADSDSMTVTAYYPKGSYIRVSGVLYKTTEDMQSGTTLVPGTNCSVITIAEDLYPLAKAALIVVDVPEAESVNVHDSADGILLKKAVAKITPIQPGSGDPSPDNIRPISGTTTIKANWRGQALWARDYATSDFDGYVNNKLLRNNNNEESNNSYYISGYMPIGGSIFCQRLNTNASNASLCFYDENKQFISGIAYAGQTVATFTTPANAKYVRMSVAKAAAGYTRILTNYHFKNIDISVNSGTVFGADAELISGKLLKTWDEIASYNGEILPGEWISDRDVYDPNTPPTTGAQVVYKLATPVEYTFDPTAIYTQYHYFGFSVESGNIIYNVEATYTADTKLYIDQKIADLQALILENI